MNPSPALLMASNCACPALHSCSLTLKIAVQSASFCSGRGLSFKYYTVLADTSLGDQIHRWVFVKFVKVAFNYQLCSMLRCYAAPACTDYSPFDVRESQIRKTATAQRFCTTEYRWLMLYPFFNDTYAHAAWRAKICSISIMRSRHIK